MNIHEWCIAVLKGRVSNMRFTELYSLCKKHYHERLFESEDELYVSLQPFNDYFIFEDFKYDYVTFDDDGEKDVPILELAKEVLRSHSNRYTLSVLCRKMNESDNMDAVLDNASLKNILSSRNCFKIEVRSMNIIRLSAKGEEYDLDPIMLRRSVKSEEDKQRETEQKLQKKLANEERFQKKIVEEQKRLLRKEILEEERERKRKLKQKKVERKEESRIEKVKMLITYYHITDETTLEKMWVDKLIRKVEYIRCADWRLYTVGQVYTWVKSRNLPERMDYYRKDNVQRLLKIASFHDPELARLIPNVKFSGIQKANRGIKLSQPQRELSNDTIDVKLGDALRWNYSKDEGIVVGFDSTDGKKQFKVQKFDGTEIMFENDPKLFIKLEGEEKDNVISKWVEYIAQSDNSAATNQAVVLSKHTKEMSMYNKEREIDNNADKDGTALNEMEIEHVFLDSHGKIIDSDNIANVNGIVKNDNK